MAIEQGRVRALAADEVQPPIVERVAILAWLRRNLFATYTDTALTLLIIYVLYITLVPFFQWAVFNATWSGDSKDACNPDGACWTIIRVRWDQYIYGLYPVDQQWRVDAGFGLLALFAVPFFVGRFRGSLAYVTAVLVVYPPIAFILFQGGVFGLELIETPQWGGLFLTLIIGGVGIAASLPIGIVLALGRRSELPIVRSLSIVFIEVVRGVPLVSILFMASVMLPLFAPEGVTFNKLLRALIGVALFSSAYMAEVVRGGLQAIPKGQYEAAQAMGLGYWQSMRLIILPQALAMVIPGIVNSFIALFKDTSLVLIIGLFDLLGMAKIIVTDPKWLGLETESYLFAAFGFWIFCFGMSRYSVHLEHKINRGKSH